MIWMKSTKEFKNLIFTDHALERLRLRGLTQENIAQVLANPAKTFPAEKPDTIKFIRSLNDRRIHVVATYLPERKKWLVISVWVRGEDDPQPLVWQIMTLPFKFSAKVAGIIWSYISKKR